MYLETYVHDDIELMINTETGEVYTPSITAAQIVGLSKASLDQFIFELKVRLLHTNTKVNSEPDSDYLIDEKVLIKIFAKYRVELLELCSEEGIRMYLHRLVQYKGMPSVTTSSTLVNILDRLKSIEDELILLRSLS